MANFEKDLEEAMKVLNGATIKDVVAVIGKSGEIQLFSIKLENGKEFAFAAKKVHNIEVYVN